MNPATLFLTRTLSLRIDRILLIQRETDIDGISNQVRDPESGCSPPHDACVTLAATGQHDKP